MQKSEIALMVRSAVSEEYGVDENRITIRRDNTDHMQEGL